MSTSIITVTADQTLEEVEHHFEYVSGLPVVDDDLGCIGIISKSDRAKARPSLGQKSTVGEVMSSPPITLPPNKTVKDAAALMLKMKIHRIPIVDERNQVIGEEMTPYSSIRIQKQRFFLDQKCCVHITVTLPWILQG
ncbi:uncharacterized protein M6B38_200950 [Iris pallida]|uniref:CBS domain-containing protein n=1 Tax=Iris pallida TaxID=29817 RepID=A0AAX6E931_IRIPA|nr:uncharacterized protein M6B38_200950 [Iris pallida]